MWGNVLQTSTKILPSPHASVDKVLKPMPRLLVVVDGTAEAAVALDRALDVATAVNGEIVLLGVEREPSSWELGRRTRFHGIVGEILARASSSAAARGIKASTRVEQGDKADVITRIAGQEGCDQIFVAEAKSTFADRALSAIAAACTGRVADRVISDAGIPVTVVAPKTTR
jgi:nucleotide-binding universal stress UspA family protein